MEYAKFDAIYVGGINEGVSYGFVRRAFDEVHSCAVDEVCQIVELPVGVKVVSIKTSKMKLMLQLVTV